MSSVAVPADRRFRRAHVKPAHRKRNGRALVNLLLLCAAIGMVVAYPAYRGIRILLGAHVLRVDRILVRGNERLSQGEVLAVLNGLRGQSLLTTDLDRWRRRLLSSPWVRDAALRRSLPSTVDVVISERQPIGIGRINSEMYLVDERGVIIDQYGPQYADLDLPIIDGLTVAAEADPKPGSVPDSLTDEPRAELAARVMASLGARPLVARRLSQVDVADLHNAAVILNGDGTVIHLGDEQFLARLQSYLDLSSTLRERVADIDSVDLRFEDRIYVRPASAPLALRRGKPVAKK